MAVVAGIVARYGVDGLFMCTLMAGVMLVPMGVATIVSPRFGELPAIGAIARTAANIGSGAWTPIAGILHALTLLAVARRDRGSG